MTRRAHPTPEQVGPGQESVWDYPRPPSLERTSRRVRVELAGTVIAESTSAFRILETSHPPNYYLPPGDVDLGYLTPAPGSSFCEWKGRATYWTVAVNGLEVVGRAWSYPAPSPPYAALKDYLSFYPSAFRCLLDDELVRPQPGDFYGGWITDEIVGPFKGDPGTLWW